MKRCLNCKHYLKQHKRSGYCLLTPKIVSKITETTFEEFAVYHKVHNNLVCKEHIWK